MLFVVEEIPFVGVAVLVSLYASPLSLSLFSALNKVAKVLGSIWPVVLSFSVCLPVLKLASVGFTICKRVSPLAVFQTHIPLSFVPVAVGPSVQSVAMCL